MSLETVSIPAGVSCLRADAFQDCSLLTNVEISAGHPAYILVDGVLFSRDGSTLVWYPAGLRGTAYTVPEGTQRIGEGAFRSCRDMEEVAFPQSLMQICDGAFTDCESLVSVILPPGTDRI